MVGTTVMCPVHTVLILLYGPRRKKPCLRFSDQAMLKQACSATETS